jgi:hypothetical protein
MTTKLRQLRLMWTADSRCNTFPRPSVKSRQSRCGSCVCITDGNGFLPGGIEGSPARCVFDAAGQQAHAIYIH